MSDLSISIFGKKIFLEILNELKLFPNTEINFYENIDLFVSKKKTHNQIILFFETNNNKKGFLKIKQKNFPTITISSSNTTQNQSPNNFVERINMPFKILDFKKKVISLIAKHQFKLSSLMRLNEYILDKNERKIKKGVLELQLTEKETNFLILFTKNKVPLSRNYVLKNVWKYSSESDTHTVETHIHRLRKKIFNKFQDNNFIKNSDKGYYI